MGSCSSQDNQVIRVNRDHSIKPLTKNHSENFDEKFTNNLEKIKLSLEPKFRDMPEWEGERYRGEGIKRMKGYKFTKPINELNELREEFWENRIKQKLIWRHLRQACLMDEGKISINYSKVC
jgi:hypothetical protein